MIRKVSLYGLCFNLGVAFGASAKYSTQMDLEAFLEGQGDRVEVTYEEIGETRFPVKIVLKDENDKEAWKTSLKDVYFYESYTESESQSEMPAVSPEVAEALPEESQSLASEGENVEEAMPPESPSSDTEDEDNPWEVCMAKEPSIEERRACFEKYSRAATDEERAWVAGWDVRELRFVTFDSIVNGLGDKAQKALALYLIQKENEDELFAMIDTWVDARKVDNKHTLHIYGPDAKKEIGSCTYKLNPEVIKCFRDKLKSILKAMSHYQSARETLVLSLVLLKDLHIDISTWGSCYLGEIVEFQVYKYEGINIQTLCHELNHALHCHLGIEGRYSLVGDLGSVFERDVFRFEALPVDKAPIRITSGLISYFFHENGGVNAPDFVEIPQHKFYRAAQVSLPWDSFEETWNIIGFANVDDCIYVNRMSDLNYMKIPALFHGRDTKFTDRLDRDYPFIDLSQYPSIHSFLEKMEETVTHHIADLCPTPEAWKIWLRLQGREDAGESYYTTVDKSLDELLALETQTLELIEDK